MSLTSKTRIPGISGTTLMGMFDACHTTYSRRSQTSFTIGVVQQWTRYTIKHNHGNRRSSNLLSIWLRGIQGIHYWITIYHSTMNMFLCIYWFCSVVLSSDIAPQPLTALIRMRKYNNLLRTHSSLGYSLPNTHTLTLLYGDNGVSEL